MSAILPLRRGLLRAADARKAVLSGGSGGVAAPAALPFDAMDAAYGAPYYLYGTTPLRTAYTGNAFRLQRTSDSVQLDWALNSLSADVIAWLGGSAYTIPLVYDQSGNGRNAVCTTLQLDLTLTTPEFVFSGLAQVDFNMSSCLGFSNGQTGLVVGAYARVTSLPAATQQLTAISNESSNSANRISIGVNSTGKWFCSGKRLNGDATTAPASAANADTTGHHGIIGTMDYTSKAAKVLLDGAVVGTATMPAGGTATPSSDGLAATSGNNGAATSAFNGRAACIVGYRTAGDATMWAALNAALAASPPPFDPSLASAGWAPNIVIAGLTKVLPGTYQGVLTAVEIATFNYADDTVVPGLDWATLDPAPASGAWTGAATLPAIGGQYYHKIRPANLPAAVVSLKAKPFSVGYPGAFGGQSNMAHSWQSAVQGTPGNADSLVWRFDGQNQNTWYAPHLARQSDEPTTLNGGAFGSNGDIGFANTARPLLNGPIGMLDVAVSGTQIERWLTAPNGGVLADGVTAGEGDCWTNVKAIIAKAGVALKFWFHMQGEGNASLGNVKGVALDASGSQWYDILGVFEAQMNAQFGNIPFILMPIHKDASGTAANCHAVYQATARYIKDNTSGRVWWGGHVKAFDTNVGDGTHFSAGQLGGTIAVLRALALAKALGFSTNGADGPEITGVAASAAAQTVDLTVTLHGGTALRDAAGGTTGASLTGFRVFVNGVAKTISSTSFIAGPKIRLTLAGGSFIAGDTIVPDYLALKPTVTNPVFDNATMPATNYVAYPYPGVPLRPTLDGILSVTAGA